MLTWNESSAWYFVIVKGKLYIYFQSSCEKLYTLFQEVLFVGTRLISNKFDPLCCYIKGNRTKDVFFFMDYVDLNFFKTGFYC